MSHACRKATWLMQPLTKCFLQVPCSHNSVLSLSQQGLQPPCDGVAVGDAAGVADAARQDKDPAVTPISQFLAKTLFLVQGP